MNQEQKKYLKERLADAVREHRDNGPKPPPEPAQVRAARAAVDIVAERWRQQSKEGWTPEHDDRHSDGSLAQAAAVYASTAAGERWVRYGPLPYWPFDSEWYKPKDPRRDLVRAAALIVAEIERLDRASKAQP